MSQTLSRLILFIVWLYRHDYRIVNVNGTQLDVQDIVVWAEIYCNEVGL